MNSHRSSPCCLLGLSSADSGEPKMDQTTWLLCTLFDTAPENKLGEVSLLRLLCGAGKFLGFTLDTQYIACIPIWLDESKVTRNENDGVLKAMFCIRIINLIYTATHVFRPPIYSNYCSCIIVQSVTMISYDTGFKRLKGDKLDLMETLRWSKKNWHTYCERQGPAVSSFMWLSWTSSTRPNTTQCLLFWLSSKPKWFRQWIYRHAYWNSKYVVFNLYGRHWTK